MVAAFLHLTCPVNDDVCSVLDAESNQSKGLWVVMLNFKEVRVTYSAWCFGAWSVASKPPFSQQMLVGLQTMTRSADTNASADVCLLAGYVHFCRCQCGSNPNHPTSKLCPEYQVRKYLWQMVNEELRWSSNVVKVMETSVKCWIDDRDLCHMVNETEGPVKSWYDMI